MAYLIDTSYFQAGQTAINNVESCGWAGGSKAASITSYIAMYEPEYLTKILGSTLYACLVANPTEARMVALIAKLRNATDEISPIANYVYYKYMQQTQQIQTEGGDKETTPAGMGVMANIPLHCAVWNWMVKQSISISDWLVDNIALYPEYNQTDDDDLDNYELFQYINVVGI